MPITKEKLEARLTALRQQLEQVKQQFFAITGAVADTEYWLVEDAKSAEPEVKD